MTELPRGWKSMKLWRTRLAALRAETGLSYRALSELSDVPHSTISHYESGTVVIPAADHVVRLARALRVSTDYLLGVTD